MKARTYDARACLGAAAIAMAAGCAHSCGSSRTAAGNPLLYVSDEDKGIVAIVDPSSAQVVASVAVGKRPRGLKLSRDGKRLFVALSGSPRGGPGVDESKLPPADRDADGIGVVDLDQRKLVTTFHSGQDPESFDLSPDGTTLYVSNEETAEMTVVDVSTGATRGRVHVGKEPEGVTVRPDGKVVFVTSEQEGEVTGVDSQTLSVVAHVPTGPRPRSIVFARDGVTGFVTDEMGAKVTVFDAVAYQPRGDIEIHLGSPMPTGPRPMGAVLSPDGKQIYVTCGRGGSVAIIDVASRKQVRSIDGVGDRPWGIASSADGRRIYTANGTSSDVSIVDLSTGNVDKRVHVGGSPWGIAIGP
jgi:YVTN family beta-propeller protein